MEAPAKNGSSLLVARGYYTRGVNVNGGHRHMLVRQIFINEGDIKEKKKVFQSLAKFLNCPLLGHLSEYLGVSLKNRK